MKQKYHGLSLLDNFVMCDMVVKFCSDFIAV